ncbi:MAG: tubulin-like doman-containing protein [Candidatus Bathyarchaeia archaeon]|jgi:hypothetical protein
MFSNIHLIGLGGTGANLIQTLLESARLQNLLQSEDFSIACLAIDVADGDLNNLQNAYKATLEKLASKGIPVEKLWVRALNIKFNTPDSLFEFMEKYDKYVEKEGIQIKNYQPWLKSSISIPPLAGGVGRQRALSKAVYNLNYFHYSELNSVMSVFKDRVLTSKFQPIVVVLFGLGGGTGSGMVMDFARHLRSKLGSSVPIIGMTILPSTADDLLARGPAPYNALMELELFFNNTLNEQIVKKYGDAYKNPLNSLFFMALDPIYNNRNNLMTAKKELDDSVIDILNMFSSFDLADLLSRVGTNNDFGSNWIHSIAYLKIKYPVDDYVKYLHEYLQLADNAGELMNSKRDVLSKINDILNNRYNEFVELYKRQLIAVGGYRADTFNNDVEDVIHRGGKYESELRKQIKGLSDFAAYYNDKWNKTLMALNFSEDTVEYSVMQQINVFRERIVHIDKNYEDYNKTVQQFMSELENSITASKFLTSTQIRQIRSYINLITLLAVAIDTTKSYLRSKALADELAIRYTKDKSRTGIRISTIGDTELLPLYKTAGVILTRAETEIKMSDNYVPSIKIIRKNIESRLKEESGDVESLQRQLNQKESEEKRIKNEVNKIWVDFDGKKRVLEKNLKNLQTELINIRSNYDEHKIALESIRQEVEKMTLFEKSLEVTSTYRKNLNFVYTKTNELNAALSQITKTGNYYERVVELSEVEQVKIMDKILKEEESNLKGDGILKDIVDRDRFRDIVKSYVRIFSVANYVGLSDHYRTDLIWTTVSIPGGLWDQQLQGMLSNTLNVFSSVEASKSISIRQIDQIDPWTITFLVIFAKARMEDLEKFSSMKSDADSVKKSERVLFRSLLLEQGIHDVSELANIGDE